MKKNKALAKLRSGNVAIGVFLASASPDLAEYVCSQGPDFVVLDWQHGEWTDESVSAALGRLIDSDTAPLVRVRGHDPGLINWVLDMGALGVVVPMVDNAEQAAAVVEPAFYPPYGVRSSGGNRLSRMAESDPKDYLASANDEMLIIPMVETEAAVANTEAIMAVRGVGAVLIGPGDLMIDVKANGHGEAEHEALIAQVREASTRTGVPAGPFCLDASAATKRAQEGFRLLLVSSDRRMVATGVESMVNTITESISRPPK